MPAQIRGDGKASNAGRAEVSPLSSCAGLGRPQMLVGCLLQEKLDVTLLNVKPCEMIIQTLLQFCTDPSMGLLLPVLHSAQFLCAACFLNIHTALSGGQCFKGEWVYNTKSSPAEHHQIITTLDNRSTDFVLFMLPERLHFKTWNVCIGKADNSFHSRCLIMLHRPCLKSLLSREGI